VLRCKQFFSSKWEALQDAEHHVVKRSKRSYASVASLPAAPSAPGAGRPLVFNRISYPLNYCQSNFAHEFAKRDVQKESHKAKCTHQKDCPMPDGASHVPASSGIRRNDSRQVVPTGAQGVRRQGRAIRN
jgi:hypothetical protein